MELDGEQLKTRGIKSGELFLRMNYLHQLAQFTALHNPELSRLYSSEMRKTAKKNVVRM